MKASNINIASSDETYLAGILMIFALLCFLARTEISSDQHSAALTFLFLFAVIAAPFPLPHIITPSMLLDLEISSATG